jgi:hypothetical protein
VSDVLRALLDEADGVAVPEEPPCEWQPVQKGETVLGLIPMDIRKLVVLAQDKVKQLQAAGDAFDATEDPDGSKLVAIYVLKSQVEILEACVHQSVKITFMRATGCEGSAWLREHWQISWSPFIDSEDEEERERRGMTS